ncbi:MAG: hypothetical protein QHH06_05140 [Clostridiales bacterium]|jgi:hypothetical protein|nr:helix-turn-helix domain-containing protein [Eubacteriales bacterium]MDH7565853.1 hypothetical protein [Clostridiales bacterium]
MIKAGKLPAKKLGKKWIFLKHEIEQIIAPNYQTIKIAARRDEVSSLTTGKEREMIEDYLKSL